MRSYRLARQADRDLEEIADFLGQRNPEAAIRVLAALRETFALLASSPLIGTPRDDLRPNLRVFRCANPGNAYVVFYYPLDKGVEISTIVHGSRDHLGMFVRGER